MKALLGPLSCAIVLFGGIHAAPTQDLAREFKGKQLHKSDFSYDGPDAKNFIANEEQGLRWRFNKEKQPTKAIGVSWRVRLHGDFMATMRYEILQVEQPERGWGVGVEMYLTLNTPEPRDGIVFARMVAPKSGPQIVFHHMTNDEKGNRTAKDPIREPAPPRSLRGRMRLAREGKTLIALLAEEDDEFKEVHRRELGNMEVMKIRFAGINGGAPNAVLDMRLLEYELQEKFVPLAAVKSDPPPKVAEDLPALSPTGSGRWTLWIVIVIGGLLLVMLVVVLALALYSRRGNNASPSPIPAKKKTAKR